MPKSMSGMRLFGSRQRDRRADDAASAQEDDDEEEEMRAAESEAQEDDEDEDEAPAAQEDDEEDDEDEMPMADKDARRAARRAARTAEKAERKRARAIDELCTLAGKPELAGRFIAEGVAESDVRKALAKQRASATKAREISGQNGPTANGAAGVAAMWDKAIARNAKAFGLRR